MRRTILSKMPVLMIAGLVFVLCVRPAQAFPTSSGGRASCLSCHGTPREAATAPALITAMPGDLVPLTTNVTNGAGTYSISLAGLGDAGLAGFTPDAAWANHFTAGTFNPDPQYGGPFYALSDDGVAWTAPATQTFNLRLASSTALGTYPLTFTVSGSGTEGLWRDANPFQLTVIPEPSTFALTSVGFFGWGWSVWRRRRRRHLR
jgi:hypothetical protein